MPAGDVHNCWYPYGWYPYQPYTVTIGGTTTPPKLDNKCPMGKHHYVRVVEDPLGTLVGRTTRLLLFCEQCGDIIEHPPVEEPEEESEHE